MLVHASDFNLLTRGAAAQHNAYLADLMAGDTHDARDTHGALDRWLAEVAGTPGALWERDADHQDFADFRRLLLDVSPRIRLTTLRFVEDWLEAVRHAPRTSTTTNTPATRDLFAAREASLKGKLAWLTHASARESRPGPMGTDYDFRWSVARCQLDDIRGGLETSEGDDER